MRRLCLTVFYYHVTYSFQSECILYSCLKVKELLARNRNDIWSLNDNYGIRTFNHLVRKRTLFMPTKWLSVHLQTKRLWVSIPLLSRLFLFYKALSSKVPKYIYELIPPARQSYRNPNWFTAFSCRTEYFKNSFFQYVIIYWNKLDSKILNSTSYLSFTNALINFIRPSGDKFFSIHDQVHIKLLAKLRLGFIHPSLKRQCIFLS